LFEQAVQLCQTLGDVRGEGESLSWVGIFHQVSGRTTTLRFPVLERSHELATQVGRQAHDVLRTRHLGIAEHTAGRLDAARERLEESVRLRREIGHLPGVAANLVGLTCVAAGQGWHEEALALIEEARTIAEATVLTAHAFDRGSIRAAGIR